MKIGIYGGTFNPIHKGHIYFAQTAIKELNLDKVILIPDNIPPHKSNRDSAPSRDRFNMCRLAAMEIPKIEVSDIEIKRNGISYTVDTLREMKIASPDDTFFLLLGTDMFCTLEKWKDYTEILRLATVVGAPRELNDLGTLLRRQKEFEAQGFKTIVLPLKPIEISSTDIRAGDDTELPKRVLSYVEQNELYGCPFKFSPDLDKIKAAVKEKLSEKRFIHSVNVANEALVLARCNNYNVTKAYVAGILHDFCKEIEKSGMTPNECIKLA
ncbi:MAG: nicotinate (nicotinamide) nucleotide adenylyltransferase, partial [Oscillospiraceae bacterium]